ncbi:MAG: hypothetical protein EOP04_28215 [Proteobacteria bacterium]|nr:MAG: hypothetical protein EOP04_28215 [Pseudomonadota bacterium]
MEFSTRTIEFEKSLIKAQIWDTAGHERFDNMNKVQIVSFLLNKNNEYHQIP